MKIRAFRCAQRLALAATLIVVLGEGATGQVAVRIEEDWELVLATPDANSAGPQVTCIISPYGNVNALYAALELNHQTQPVFEAGGLQLQVWYGETPHCTREFPEQGVLSTSGEQITWTQSVRLHSDQVIFEVFGGESTTWGRFGGQGYLRASVPTELVNLNGYDPQVSVDNSGVGYAANRVTSLTLRQVRVTLDTGTVLIDETPRVVFAQ